MVAGALSQNIVRDVTYVRSLAYCASQHVNAAIEDEDVWVDVGPMTSRAKRDVSTLMLAGIRNRILDSGSEGNELCFRNACSFIAVESFRQASRPDMVCNLFVGQREAEQPLYDNDGVPYPRVNGARKEGPSKVNVRPKVAEG